MIRREFDPEGFGERLGEALDEKGWDIRTLQESVRDRHGKVPGSSYGAVWSYVRGQAPQEPRPDAVAAMADVLGCTVPWLLHGEGPRSEEAAAQERAVRELEEEELAEEAYERQRRILEAVGQGSGLGRSVTPSPLEGSAILDVCSRLGGEEVAHALGEALSAPLNCLGLEPTTVKRPELREYVLAMCTALRHLEPAHRRAELDRLMDEARSRNPDQEGADAEEA